jgi:hypothetical protein
VWYVKTPLLPLASSVLHDGKREGAASAVWTVTSAKPFTQPPAGLRWQAADAATAAQRGA